MAANSVSQLPRCASHIATKIELMVVIRLQRLLRVPQALIGCALRPADLRQRGLHSRDP